MVQELHMCFNHNNAVWRTGDYLQQPRNEPRNQAMNCCPYMANLKNIWDLIWRRLQLKFLPLRKNEDCCLCHKWARMVASLFRPCHQLLLGSRNPSVVIINQMLPKPRVKHCLCCTWTQFFDVFPVIDQIWCLWKSAVENILTHPLLVLFCLFSTKFY